MKGGSPEGVVHCFAKDEWHSSLDLIDTFCITTSAHRDGRWLETLVRNWEERPVTNCEHGSDMIAMK